MTKRNSLAVALVVSLAANAALGWMWFSGRQEVVSASS